MARKKIKAPKLIVPSIIIALIVGGIIGWYFSTIVLKTIDLLSNGVPLLESNTITIIISMVIFASLFVYIDTKKPVLVESIGFIFSIFVFLQFFLWDYPAGDINNWRVTMFFVAVGLFILNVFTGHLRWKSGIRMIERAVGAK